jgi:hypothetical protein
MKPFLHFFRILVVLSFLIFVSACAGERTYAKYRLVNSTAYSIQIKSYLKSTTELLNSINIESDNSWSSEEFETTEGYRSAREIILKMGDSILITFGNQRFIVLEASLDDPPTGIWLDENYEIAKVRENTEVFSYSFTNEDYENAEDIVD